MVEAKKVLAIIIACALVIGAGFGIVALIGISIKNGAITREEQCNASLSNIDSQQKKRNELIGNLVETVKAGASHEHRTMLDTIAQRNSGITEGGTIENAAVSIQAVAEQYPSITATELFKDNMTALQKLEQEIFNYREAYNAAVKQYNTYIRNPWNALFLGGEFERLDMLNYESNHEAPEVSYEISYE